MPSELERAVRRHRAALLRREAAAAGEMVRAYGAAWTRIRGELERLLARMEAARAAGETVSPAWLFRRDRLTALERQAEAELREFARFAADSIRREQAAAIAAAQADAADLARTALGEAPPAVQAASPAARVTGTFDRLPAGAVAELVGAAGDGSPLRALLDELGEAGSRAVRDALVTGVATGQGPRAIATRLRRELGGNLVRALRISRTETLRAYRSAALESYRANADVVGGWVWIAKLDGRTCAACIAMHGTEHGLEEDFGSHVNCRCTPAPRTRSWEEILAAETGETSGPGPGAPEARPARQTGVEWFDAAPEAVQREILGPAKLRAYREGRLALPDLVGFRRDPRWGPVRWERNLREALAAAERGAGEMRLPAFFAGVLRGTPRRPAPSADSVAAAETWARAHIRGLQAVDYSGCDLEVANALNRTAREIADHFGVDVPRIGPYAWIRRDEGRDSLMAGNAQGLFYNPRLLGQGNSALAEVELDLQRHTAAAAKSLDGLVAHEMAHLLERFAGDAPATAGAMGRAELLLRNLVQDYRAREGEARIRAELGARAWEGDPDLPGEAWRETWAQAFSAFWIDPTSARRPTWQMVRRALSERRRR